MAELVHRVEEIAVGEPYFAVRVDRPAGIGAIVATLAMDQVGPATVDKFSALQVSGFDLPALEMIEKAQARAEEQGIQKILVLDSGHLLGQAKINRYARRR